MSLLLELFSILGSYSFWGHLPHSGSLKFWDCLHLLCNYYFWGCLINLSIFVLQCAAAPKNGVKFRQGTIGVIKSILATLYDIWWCCWIEVKERSRCTQTHTLTDKNLDIMNTAALCPFTVKCLKIQDPKNILNLLANTSRLLEFEFRNFQNWNYSMKYSENWTFHTGYEDIQVTISSIEFFRILKRL